MFPQELQFSPEDSQTQMNNQHVGENEQVIMDLKKNRAAIYSCLIFCIAERWEGFQGFSLERKESC